MSYGPTLVVHPELHTSGFGNQLGMLLQHLSIAALSHVQLVVPPLHVPVEHRQAPAFAEVLADPDSTLAPLELHPARQARHIAEAQGRFDAER